MNRRNLKQVKQVMQLKHDKQYDSVCQWAGIATEEDIASTDFQVGDHAGFASVSQIQGGRATPTCNIAKCLLHCYTCDYQNRKEISNRTCELPISPPCESPPCFRRFFPFFLRSMEPCLLRRSLICADIEIPEIVLVFHIFVICLCRVVFLT